MQFPTFYKVVYQDETLGNTLTDQGLLFADSYGDAANKIGKYYGENNILTLEIIQVEDSPILPISDIAVWYDILHLSHGNDFTGLLKNYLA